MHTVDKRWSPVRYLHALAAEQLSDGELLGRYVQLGDEDAFTEIVRRNGPLVFRVCRNALGETTTAEDAFQATFLTLTLRARSIAEKGAIANALHEHVWPLLESRLVTPIVFRTFQLREAAAAHRLMESSAHIGKLVLTLV